MPSARVKIGECSFSSRKEKEDIVHVFVFLKKSAIDSSLLFTGDTWTISADAGDFPLELVDGTSLFKNE